MAWTRRIVSLHGVMTLESDGMNVTEMGMAVVEGREEIAEREVEGGVKEDEEDEEDDIQFG
jgi:hypothetical protein